MYQHGFAAAPTIQRGSAPGVMGVAASGWAADRGEREGPPPLPGSPTRVGGGGWGRTASRREGASGRGGESPPSRNGQWLTYFDNSQLSIVVGFGRQDIPQLQKGRAQV